MEHIKDMNVDIFKLFDDHWALLTAGTSKDYNTMPISWGSLGTIWAPRGNGKQIALCKAKALYLRISGKKRLLHHQLLPG